MSADIELLKRQAIDSQCGCFHYDIWDNSDDIEINELNDMINDPLYCHKLAIHFDNNDPDELWFMHECPVYKQLKN